MFSMLPKMRSDDMDSIELLKQLVEIPSIFPNEGPIGEFLEQQLQERGFTTKRIYLSEGRFSVVGERGTRGRPFMLYGHSDTVPVYGQWQGSPFTFRESGDKLHALGIYDMKAGVAAILKACEVQTDSRIKVGFGADEENNSAGAWSIVNDGFVKDVDGVLVPEINDTNSAHESDLSIMLGRRGRSVFEFSIPGKSSHGAHLEDGINAISEASRLALELDKLNSEMPTHTHLPRASQFVRKIYAESTSLSLPEVATVDVDRHLVPPETSNSVLDGLQHSVASFYDKGIFREIDGRRITVKLKPRNVPYLEPYVTPATNLLVQKLTYAAGIDPKQIPYTYGGSVADENVFAMQRLSVMDLCPRGGNYHQANEWVSKKSYLHLVDALSGFVKSL